MMSREHHRRRSPESSRRRRKERRDSREQLQNHPVPASIPPYEESFTQPHQHPYQASYQQPFQDPYQVSYQSPYQPEPSLARDRDRDRDRGHSSSFSSTTSSSSTSSSLLNISQPAKGFGIGSFFSGNIRKQRRRIKKKRSKILRFGNSSSSSVGSDLAYGRGYIDRRRSREFSPPTGHRPPERDSDPGRPRPPKRAQTDEEIIELGRKFAELARQQNTDDLRAAGRSRPSTLTSAATALNQFRRTNSGNVNKGIGNSKPRRDSSPDDSDWESASSDDESGEDDSDNGLAYGSSHHLPSNSEKPPHLGASVHPAQTYSQDIPLNRKPSLVDPKLFGPINSLRGFVRTPCGFERVDRKVVDDVHPHYEPSIAPGETVVSAEGRPMQHVYPVPTSDPSRFDADRGSIISAHQSLTSSSRPDPVPIQQPKPIAPVYRKVFDSVDPDPKYLNKSSAARTVAPTSGIGLPDATINTPLSSDAAIGVLLRAAQRADYSKYQEPRSDDSQWRPERSGDKKYDGKHEKDESRDTLRDVPPEKPYKKDQEATRNDQKEKRRREKKESDLDRDFKRESRRRDKYHDNLDRPAKVEGEERDSRDDQKVSRQEQRREKPVEDQIGAHEPKIDVPAPSEVPSIERSKGIIDPFQFQVADDAFPTPRYGTPARPLTPVIMTVDREPDFSKFESYKPTERLSRKDSFERELQDAQNAYKAAEQATVPVSKAAFAAAAAAEMAERRHKRSPERDPSSRGRSQESSSSARAKDPVLDDADRAYREARLARRIREQEERSRSNSPDSVVDKWEEKESANIYRVVTPPAMDHPKVKNPFDGPNADVRIDNVLEHPKELSRFRISESRRRSSTFPIFSARDPSAERERPMLNLVRPTPAPSPTPEKQQLKSIDLPSPVTEADPNSVPAEIQKEVVSTSSAAPSKVVTWGENQTKHYVIESPEREDDPYSGTKIITPAETPRSRTDKKINWGAIAATISGVGVGIAASSISDHATDTDAPREHVASKDPGQQSKRRRSLPSDALYDDPPIPGPKPPSPRSPQMPGRFAEDPVFMANIAAGLEGSGFDPNIIIDDAKFHRRDSPPGSNEPYDTSAAATSRIMKDNDRNRGETSFATSELRDSATEKEILPNDFEIFSRLSNKERRKQEKAAKLDLSDKSVSVIRDDPTLEMPSSASEEDWSISAKELAKKEQRKRDRAAKTEAQGDSQRRSKKSKRAIVIQQGPSQVLERDPQKSSNVEPFEVADLVDTSLALDYRIRDSDAILELISHDPEHVIDDSVAAREEEWTAPTKDKKKKKKAKRDSLAEETVPSTTVAPELSRESSYTIVEPEINPILVGEWNLAAKEKQNKSNLKDADFLPRSLDVSEAPEETNKLGAGEEASEPATRDDVVDDWDSSTKQKKASERDSSSSYRTPFIEDIIESPKNIVDSSSDPRSESVAATEEEWEDLPKKAKKKRKKKSKRDAAAREESPPASQSAPRSEVSVEDYPTKTLGEGSFTDLPLRSTAPEANLEEKEKPEEEKRKSAPGEFPEDEGVLNERKPLDGIREQSRFEDKKEKGTSSFFGRFKSSIGFGEGKEPPRTQNDEQSSFLDNAGALGASAGLTGAVIALTPQPPTENATDTAVETASPEETKATKRRSSSPSPAELIDPEIVEREIRPAIDPTYGDLLPLPPSRSSSPVPVLDESIPPLPESRPGTPEDDRERLLLAQKSTHSRRRSDIPLRVKTPSQSAIPIQFRIGLRAAPASPAPLKQSPSASPITASSETGSTSKARGRPMSWEGSRTFMPLFLLERSRESVATPTSLQEEPQSSNVSDGVPDVSSPTPSHTGTPHDDPQDDCSRKEAAAQQLESPELPPLKPVDDPESPTPRPDPVDPVSKNRSSYLLYSSPSGSQNPDDADISEGSPSLRAAKRHIALDELEEDTVGVISDGDLLLTAAAGLATGALVANVVADDHTSSPEVPPDAKDSTTLGVTSLGEFTEIGKIIDANETGAKDNEPGEAALITGKKSKKGKKGKKKSQEIEPVAEATSEEPSVDAEIPLSSDTFESIVKTDAIEDEFAPAKLSKKEKKKKKKEQRRGILTENEETVEASLPIEDPEEEFFDASVEQFAVEPQAEKAETDSRVDTYTGTPAETSAEIVEPPAETSFKPVVEAPVEVPVETPVEASVATLVDAASEARIKPIVEAPLDTIVEAPLDTIVEAPLDTIVEAPLDTTVEAPLDVPVEAPLDTTVEAPLDVPVEVSVEVPAEASVEVPAEVPAEVSVEAPLEAAVAPSTEAFASDESVGTTKKEKQEKGESQVPVPGAEEERSLTMLEGDGLEETTPPATDERAVVEGSVPTHEGTVLELDMSSTSFETPSTVSKKGKKKKGKKSALSKEEPITPDAAPATEHLPMNAGRDIAYPIEAETPGHGSEHVQRVPVEAEDVPPESKAEGFEDISQSSPAAEEWPATTSKKSKKKKKKISQALESDQESSAVADTKTHNETVEEVKQSETELSSLKALDETSLATEAIPSAQIPTASADSLLNVSAEIVERSPDVVSGERDEKLEPISETWHSLSDNKKSGITEIEPALEEKLNTHESEGEAPIQASEPSSMPLEEHPADTSQSSALNNVDESQLKPDPLSGEETQQGPQSANAPEDPLTEKAVDDLHATSTRPLEAAELSSDVLEAVGDNQPSLSDHLAIDEPAEAMDRPDESRGKKKAKKNKKKKQNALDLSDVQETAPTSPKIEDVQETAPTSAKIEDVQKQPVEEASSTDQTTEVPSTVLDRTIDLECAEAPTDDALPDTGSLSDEFKKGKEGEEYGRVVDVDALDEAEEALKPAEEVVGSNDQGIIDSERPATPSQAEPTANDSLSEPTMSAKKGKKKGKKKRQSADFSAPIEDVHLPEAEADLIVSESVVDTTQAEPESSSLVTTEADLPTEKEMPEAEPPIEAPSSKKKSKKDKKKRGSAELDLSNSDIISETTQQSAIVATQSSDVTDSLAEPAVIIPDVDASQVVNNADDFSPSKKSKKNKKRQSLAVTEDEDTSDFPGPIPEAVFDLKEVSHIPEQVKEDDADVSSTSTSTKQSKKEKKKKRKSVQFVEPIEESREIPAEGHDIIAASEVTAEPDEISLDALNEATTPADSTSSPFDSSRSLDQGHDVQTAQNLTEQPSLGLDPSSVPLPADEDSGAYLPDGVFNRSIPSLVQSKDDHIPEQPKHGETASADQGGHPQPLDDIETSMHPQSRDDNEIQKPIENEPDVTESNITSDASVKPGDLVLSDDKSLAEAMPITEDPIQAATNDEIPLETKKSKKDKKKRKGKSRDNQESASDPAALSATIDDGVPMREDQETPPATLSNEPAIERDEGAEPGEQVAIEHPVVQESSVVKPAVEEPTVEEQTAEELAIDTAVEIPAVKEPTVKEPAVDTLDVDTSAVELAQDDIISESSTKKSKKGKKKRKKGSKVLEDEPTQPSEVAPSSALDDVTAGQDNVVNVPQSAVQEETEGASKASDALKLPTDEQGLPFEEPSTSLLPTPNDQSQSSQDDQLGTTILQPEDEVVSLVEPVMIDTSTEEPTTLTTLELERSLDTQISEEQSEPTVARKSKKEKKKKKRDSRLSVDQPDTTEIATTEPTVGVETPAVVIEQTTTESLPDTSENQTSPADPVETDTQEVDSHPETEPVSVAPRAPEIESSIDLSKLPDQLPVSSKATVEDVEQTSIKEDKEYEIEQASLLDIEPSMPEPGESSAEPSATVQTSEGAGLSISPSPEESKDDNTTNTASSKKTKKDKKKKKKVASLGDEEVPLELPVEPAELAEPASGSLEQNDAILSTGLDNSPANVPPESEDTQAKEVVNVDSSSSIAPTKQSKKDKKKKKQASLTDIEVASEPQPEPAQSGPVDLEKNNLGLSIESESPPVEEAPKTEDTEDISTPTVTKKSKKKKKKAADREEEVPLEDQKELADPMLGEREQSYDHTTIPAEAPEKDTQMESVSKDADAAQDETIPQEDLALKDTNIPKDDGTQDGNAPKVEDNASDETLPMVESNPRDEAPQSETIDQNDSGHRDDEYALRREPTLEKQVPIEAEASLQDKPIPDSQPLDDLTPQKGKKSKRKKKRSISQPNELPEEIPTEGPIPTTADLVQPADDQTPIPALASENDNDLAESAPEKKGEEEEEKKGISYHDEVSREQATSESAVTATDRTTDSVIIEPPALESSNDNGLADLAAPIEKDKKNTSSGDEILVEKLIGDAAAGTIDPVLNEPPAPEPSNDDGSAQSTSTKKSKKDKKKRKQTVSLQDETASQALPEEDLREVREERAQEKLPREEIPQGEPPKEDLSREDPLKEQPPLEEPIQEEPIQEEPVQEEPVQEEPVQEEPIQAEVSEVAQDTLHSEEPGQITLPHEVEVEVPSEPATVTKPREPANEDTSKTNIPPNDDLLTLTPTKKSKKDKKKKKPASSSDAEVMAQEEPVLEDSHPIAVAESLPETRLPTEGQAPEAVMPDEVRADDPTPLTPTKKGKKDKKKKQALREANITQEPVETSADADLPAAPNASGQAQVEVFPPDMPEDTEVNDLPSAKKSKKGGKKKEPISWEDESLLQPGSSQEPGISRDASAEASQSEGFLEFTLGLFGRGRKDKKKQRASTLEVKPEPEAQTGVNPESASEPVEAVGSTEINDSSTPGEQPPVLVTDDQDVITQETKTPIQDEREISSNDLNARVQVLDTASREETVPSMKLDEVVGTNIGSKLNEGPTKIIPEGATQELSSEDQQTTTRAVGNEPLGEVALETGPVIGTDNPPLLQEPETMQLEEAAPKVDDGTDTVSNKKSKKDKKKKKRASQVSWEPEPEAEIEDLPEQQQSERTFDEQPMTTDNTKMGNSDEAIEDPFLESASDKKSEKNKRQNQMDWEPEPNSEKAVEEPKPFTPAGQGQHDDMLLDHQSLAEDTQTSLKHSTDLDDTFLKTTSSKKSKKKKKKASQPDGGSAPATPIESEPIADSIIADQGIIEKSPELVDALSSEATKTVQAEAIAENFPREIVSTKQSKEDEQRAKKQSTAETPEPESDIGQPAKNNPSDNQDAMILPSTLEGDLDMVAEEDQPEKPMDTTDTSRDFPQMVSDFSTKISKKEKRKAKKVQELRISEADSNANSGVNLQSWDWSHIDDKTQAEIPVPETVSVTEEPSEVKPRAITPPSDSPHETSQQEQNEESNNEPTLGKTDSDLHAESQPESQPEPASEPQPEPASEPQPEPASEPQPEPASEPQPEPASEPQPEPAFEESPITRKKSKKDKKKKKRPSQSESEQVSGVETSEAQDYEGGDDLQDVAVPDQTIRETEMLDEQDSGRASSGKKTKGDKKRGKALVLEETPSESHIIPSSQNLVTPQQQSLDEIPQGETKSPETQSLLESDDW
ncbi:hypothetical protein F5Y12DRAFT_499381 [Xylaria sp. FL1777]|nr:hypothetical protein F5Y12DRAFT_499381 [Xylaria sp. FL1777]